MALKYTDTHSGTVRVLPWFSSQILSVRRLEGDLQDVLDELAGREWGREMHAFPYRRLDARSVM